MSRLTQDEMDLISIAHFRGGNVRCPGRRIIPEGYVCIHCRHDFTDDRKCGLDKVASAQHEGHGETETANG